MSLLTQGYRYYGKLDIDIIVQGGLFECHFDHRFQSFATNVLFLFFYILQAFRTFHDVLMCTKCSLNMMIV